MVYPWRLSWRLAWNSSRAREGLATFFKLFMEGWQ